MQIECGPAYRDCVMHAGDGRCLLANPARTHCQATAALIRQWDAVHVRRADDVACDVIMEPGEIVILPPDERQPATPAPVKPRRAVELSVQVGGDTWADVLAKLEEIVCELQRLQPERANSCSGSPSSYSSVRCETRAITHDEYMAEVASFLEAADVLAEVKQIGNSVPVELATALCLSILGRDC